MSTATGKIEIITKPKWLVMPKLYGCPGMCRSKQHLFTRDGDFYRAVCGQTNWVSGTVKPLLSDVKCKRCLRIEAKI